jgi:hypothetical protein
MRYNVGFLRGFLAGDGSLPLAADGDETTLVLTKGDDFQAWLTDETRIKLNDGPVGEVPAWVQNRTTLHRLVDAWLDGIEFKENGDGA